MKNSSDHILDSATLHKMCAISSAKWMLDVRTLSLKEEQQVEELEPRLRHKVVGRPEEDKQ